MTISMYEMSVPVFIDHFEMWSGILLKGETFAEIRKIDQEILVKGRLAPDMYPLDRQIQIGTDMVRKGIARLASVDAPSYEDSEITFSDLQERIKNTVHFLHSITPEQMMGSEDKGIVFSIRENEFTFEKGSDYLTQWIIPHFFFHMTTSYNILRSNGVKLGKRNFVKM
jgi:uncharacterized protein